MYVVRCSLKNAVGNNWAPGIDININSFDHDGVNGITKFYRYQQFFGFFETYLMTPPANISALRCIVDTLRIEWDS